MSNTIRGVSRLFACLLLATASAACVHHATSTPAVAPATQAVIASSAVDTAGLKPLALTDVMKFREISQRQVSENQQVMLYTAEPDFGDSTGYLINLRSGQQFSVERGDKGQLTVDGRFALFRQQAPLLAREQATDKKAREALAQNAVLLNSETGEQRVIANIDRFAFSGDGNYALLLVRKADSKDRTQTLQALELASGNMQTLAQVTDFAVAAEGALVAWVAELQATESADPQTDKQPAQQQLLVWDSAANKQFTAHDATAQKLHQLKFNEQGSQLVFFSGPDSDQLKASNQTEAAQQLWLWSLRDNHAQQLNTTREGWLLSEHYAPRWTEDGKRLFIGHRPDPGSKPAKIEPPQTEAELYNVERLLADRRLQVWHGDDERINSQQKAEYKQAAKRTAASVIWLDSLRMVVLSDDIDEQLQFSEHSAAQLISNSKPYFKQMTWNGRLHDVWHVNLSSGKRQQVFSANRSHESAYLSPTGRYVVYLQDGAYQLFDSTTGSTRPLAADVPVSWVDELNDRPVAAESYGVAGWLADETAVLLYDRFDIWQASLNGSSQKLTNGRAAMQQFRVKQTGDELALATDAALLLGMYNEQTKQYGFARLQLAKNADASELTVLLQGKKRYDIVDTLNDFSEAQPHYLYSEQSFRQFPDLWLASANFSERRQLTNVNPQQADFIWGDSHLIEWTSATGEPLQGVLLTPDGYDAVKRYPVVVYYYEKFSQRLHHYNQMKVNHRPNFPYYLGQDYLVFLPDIHFRPAAPGPSATESLVPGLQKLIDMGIADPKAIGLHGHSWSGYQTAFVVAETDMFAAAVSGAPVANMTSAYSGIRWQSGLARQFQYETGQSRLGVSMFEELKPYIDNSPVFFADQINTPMLIQFGDEDGAVPWEQGIEYYLALRRLGKEVVMLQYEGEPHHLQRFANKLDYSIKMREFFDHYLKGAPAPKWWTDGEPYRQYEK
ncbi:S9 family peptidase [Arsukibacterium indicum]|uniref:Prolyl oligopeptidase family serine peptidase n=1 Tax=Arsukibacterium indicum TaxID=2848612 RepID=A0ABS6MFH3_9GAMM|nr:prolyl oligopeptidase family serine peptidase [Arsukibacterium indicum]MBV2127554.1 prolyl oligopeptidase family serine peptidase [Arsukibacterium indicum]